MLVKIRQFFISNLDPGTDRKTASNPDARRRLAAAALMVELMHTDNQLDAREFSEFLKVLKTTFALSEASLTELDSLARDEASQATSLYQFTRLINDLYSYDEKVLLIENMWRIAFADEVLNKYEDHLIRKVAELIHVSHSDFIRTKLRIRPGAND
ncbi:MAG: TerB family tellurite resistance protein [Pseudohongiellaceae bacterium]